MPKKASRNPADYIVPLNMNGLEGRMLRLPAPATKQAAGREILFVYGLHSSLERWWGAIQVLNRYGAVTVPDLPGFGGMDSFYKIGKKPTLDNLADYMASFIKLRYRNKKVVIVGLSFGFIVITRMLQRYPDMTKKVTLLVSIVGFAHHDDFTFSKPRYYTYLYGTRLLSYRIPAALFHHIALNPWLLRTFYGHTHNAKHKFAQAKDPEELKRYKDVEVGLWRNNDARTWGFTVAEFLTFDNCRVRVNLPVWHVAAKSDNYFDHHLVEQHMRVIFSGFNSGEFKMTAHAPTVMADEKAAAGLLPPKLRRVLSQAR
jgi:pimeloyl-ACP methyl ester carboxylesterase